MEKGKKGIVFDENLDLGDLDMAAKLPLNQLTIDLTEIKMGYKVIESCLSNEKVDHFNEKFQKLATKLEKIIKILEEKIKSCEKFYESTAIFLCENPKESSDKLGEKLFKFW